MTVRLDSGATDTIFRGVPSWRAAVPDLERLRQATEGDRRVSIAVLDGPVDLSHPCFAGADLTVVETVVSAASGDDPASHHGTQIASLIFGRPGSAVAGIAPGCRGLIVPVFGSSPNGGLRPCSQLELARAIVQAVEHGAQVVNVSAGAFDPVAAPHPHLAAAVRLCTQMRVLLVAAVGNDGCDCLHLPAALPTVLAVGAVDGGGTPLPFSNWGSAYRDHGVVAPGACLSTSTPGGGFAPASGTSVATAVVSGVAGLLLSLQLAQGRLDPLAVRAAILLSATQDGRKPLADRHRLLAGRLDILAAAALLLEKGTTAMSEQASISEPSALSPSSGVVAPDSCLPPAGTATGTAAPSASPPPAAVAAAREDVLPTCACRGGRQPVRVYALGQIGVDFASQARRDSFIQQGVGNPDDPAALLAFLGEHPEHATAVTWLLLDEATPIYAVQPAGAFAAQGYGRLREALEGQLAAGVERVSVPGLVDGTVRLLDGQTVPVIAPDVRGLFSWSTQALLAELLGETAASGEVAESRATLGAELTNFLDRVYFEMRNLGLAAPDRALNFAATNAFQVERVYQSVIQEGLRLDAISTERSPICRPESDCWDVKLLFFNPMRRLEQAREVYRITVDVSDVIPVTVGRIRHWQIF